MNMSLVRSYYASRERAKCWHVFATWGWGGNKELIDTFTNARAARYAARQLNIKAGHM